MHATFSCRTPWQGVPFRVLLPLLLVWVAVLLLLLTVQPTYGTSSSPWQIRLTYPSLSYSYTPTSSTVTGIQGGVSVKPSAGEDWGTICTNGFLYDQYAAKIVCRSVGFTGGNPTYSYSPGTGVIYMDQLYCASPSIVELDACSFVRSNATTTLTSCNHYQDAGVQCTFPTFEFRLASTTSPSSYTVQGRVEARPILSSGSPFTYDWGTVCSDGMFGFSAALILCRSLGYVRGSTINNFGGGTGNVYLSSLNCPADVTLGSLNNCSFTYQNDAVQFTSATPCDHSQDVGVSCSSLELEYRLGSNVSLNGGQSLVGRLEVRAKGTSNDFGAVCDSPFDVNAATVVCRSLGYNVGSFTTPGADGAGGLNIVISDVSCPNDAIPSFDMCEFGYYYGTTSTCSSSAVWLRCDVGHLFTYKLGNPSAAPGGIRGVVLVQPAPTLSYGTMCALGGFNDTAAQVLCNSLGYESGVMAPSGSMLSSSTTNIYMRNVSCNSSSISSLDYCSFAFTSPLLEGSSSATPLCTHADDVVVLCTYPQFEYQLGLGTNGYRGRQAQLQVRPVNSTHMENSQWGLVCGNAYYAERITSMMGRSLSGDALADTACRQFGYSSGSYQSYPSSFSGGPLYFTDVSCPTGASSMSDCTFLYFPAAYPSVCDHANDFSLICVPTIEARLVRVTSATLNGQPAVLGNLQVRSVVAGVASGWGVSCGSLYNNGLDTPASQVACVMLGYSSGTVVPATTYSYPGAVNETVAVVSNLYCNANSDVSLSTCTFYFNDTNCPLSAVPNPYCPYCSVSSVLGASLMCAYPYYPDTLSTPHPGTPLGFASESIVADWDAMYSMLVVVTDIRQLPGFIFSLVTNASTARVKLQVGWSQGALSGMRVGGAMCTSVFSDYVTVGANYSDFSHVDATCSTLGLCAETFTVSLQPATTTIPTPFPTFSLTVADAFSSNSGILCSNALFYALVHTDQPFLRTAVYSYAAMTSNTTRFSTNTTVLLDELSAAPDVWNAAESGMASLILTRAPASIAMRQSLRIKTPGYLYAFKPTEISSSNAAAAAGEPLTLSNGTSLTTDCVVHDVNGFTATLSGAAIITEYLMDCSALSSDSTLNSLGDVAATCLADSACLGFTTAIVNTSVVVKEKFLCYLRSLTSGYTPDTKYPHSRMIYRRREASATECRAVTENSGTLEIWIEQTTFSIASVDVFINGYFVRSCSVSASSFASGAGGGSGKCGEFNLCFSGQTYDDAHVSVVPSFNLGVGSRSASCVGALHVVFRQTTVDSVAVLDTNQQYVAPSVFQTPFTQFAVANRAVQLSYNTPTAIKLYYFGAIQFAASVAQSGYACGGNGSFSALPCPPYLTRVDVLAFPASVRSYTPPIVTTTSAPIASFSPFSTTSAVTTLTPNTTTAMPTPVPTTAAPLSTSGTTVSDVCGGAAGFNGFYGLTGQCQTNYYCGGLTVLSQPSYGWVTVTPNITHLYGRSKSCSQFTATVSLGFNQPMYGPLGFPLQIAGNTFQVLVAFPRNTSLPVNSSVPSSTEVFFAYFNRSGLGVQITAAPIVTTPPPTSNSSSTPTPPPAPTPAAAAPPTVAVDGPSSKVVYLNGLDIAASPQDRETPLALYWVDWSQIVREQLNSSMIVACVFDWISANNGVCNINVPLGVNYVKVWVEQTTFGAAFTQNVVTVTILGATATKSIGKTCGGTASFLDGEPTYGNCGQYSTCVNQFLYTNDSDAETRAYTTMAISVPKSVGSGQPCQAAATVLVEFSVVDKSIPETCEFLCYQGRRCISYDKVCDGVTDCSDESDEASCDSFVVVEETLQFPTVSDYPTVEMSPFVYLDCVRYALGNNWAFFVYSASLRTCWIYNATLDTQLAWADYPALVGSAVSDATLSFNKNLGTTYRSCSARNFCNGRGTVVRNNRTSSEYARQCVGCLCDSGYTGSRCDATSSITQFPGLIVGYPADTNTSWSDLMTNTQDAMDILGLDAELECDIVLTLDDGQLGVYCVGAISESTQLTVAQTSTLTLFNEFLPPDADSASSLRVATGPAWASPAASSCTTSENRTSCELLGPTTVHALRVGWSQGGTVPSLTISAATTTSARRSGAAAPMTFTCSADALLLNDQSACAEYSCIVSTGTMPITITNLSAVVDNNDPSGGCTSPVISSLSFMSAVSIPSLVVNGPVNSANDDFTPFLIGGVVFLVVSALFAVVSCGCYVSDQRIVHELTVETMYSAELTALEKMLKSTFLKMGWYQREEAVVRQEKWNVASLVVALNLVVCGMFLILYYGTASGFSSDHSILLEVYPSVSCDASVVSPVPYRAVMIESTSAKSCVQRGVVGTGSSQVIAAGYCDMVNGVATAFVKVSASNAGCEVQEYAEFTSGSCVPIAHVFLSSNETSAYIKVSCAANAAVASRFVALTALSTVSPTDTILVEALPHNYTQYWIRPELDLSTTFGVLVRYFQYVGFGTGPGLMSSSQPLMFESAVSGEPGMFPLDPARFILELANDTFSTRDALQLDPTTQTAAKAVAVSANGGVLRSFAEDGGPRDGDMHIGRIFNAFTSANQTAPTNPPANYYGIETTFADVGNWFGETLKPSDGDGVTFSLYIRCTRGTAGFAFAVTDAYTNFKDHTSPILAKAAEIITKGQSPDTWFTEVYHIYASLYVNGPAGTLHFVHANPKRFINGTESTADAIAKPLENLAWDVDTLGLGHLFNGLWHHVVVILRTQNDQTKAQLMVDGITSLSLTGWNQCMQRRPTAIQNTSLWDKAPSYASAQERFYPGGALTVGYLDGGVGHLKISARVVPRFELWREAPIAVAAHNALDMSQYQVLGCLMVVLAVVAFVYMLVHSGLEIMRDKAIRELEFHDRAKEIYEGVLADKTFPHAPLPLPIVCMWLELTTEQFIIFLDEIRASAPDPCKELFRVLFMVRTAKRHDAPLDLGAPLPKLREWKELVTFDEEQRDRRLAANRRWGRLRTNLGSVVEMTRVQNAAANGDGAQAQDAALAGGGASGDSGAEGGTPTLRRPLAAKPQLLRAFGEAMDQQHAEHKRPVVSGVSTRPIRNMTGLISFLLKARSEEEALRREELELQDGGTSAHHVKKKRGTKRVGGGAVVDTSNLGSLGKSSGGGAVGSGASSGTAAGAATTPSLPPSIRELAAPIVIIVQSVYVWIRSIPFPRLYDEYFRSLLSFVAIDWAVAFPKVPTIVTPILQFFAGMMVFSFIVYHVKMDEYRFAWHLARYILKRDQSLREEQKQLLEDERGEALLLKVSGAGSSSKKDGDGTLGVSSGSGVGAEADDDVDPERVEAFKAITWNHLEIIDREFPAPFGNYIGTDYEYHVTVLPVKECQKIDRFLGFAEKTEEDQALGDCLEVTDDQGATFSLQKPPRTLGLDAEKVRELLDVQKIGSPVTTDVRALTDHEDRAERKPKGATSTNDAEIPPNQAKLPQENAADEGCAEGETVVVVADNQDAPPPELLVRSPTKIGNAEVGMEATPPPPPKLELAHVGCFCREHIDRRLTSQVQSSVWPYIFPPSCVVTTNGKRCGCNVGVMFSCGLPTKNPDGSTTICDYAVCERHMRMTPPDIVKSLVLTLPRNIERQGWSWFFATVLLLIANAAYTPFMQTTLMILACDPYYQCDFPTCWGSTLDQKFALAVFLSMVIVLFLGVGLPVLQTVQLQRSRGLMRAAFFSEEYHGIFESDNDDDDENEKDKKAKNNPLEKKDEKCAAGGTDNETQVDAFVNADENRVGDNSTQVEIMGAAEDVVDEGEPRIIEARKPGDASSSSPVRQPVAPDASSHAPQLNGSKSAEAKPSSPPSEAEKRRERRQKRLKMDEWISFVSSDPTVMGTLYKSLEFEWLYLSPLILMWKVIMIIPVVFLPQDSFQQRAGMAVSQIGFALFVFTTTPFISPVVDAMYRLGAVHQLLFLGVESLNIVQLYNGGTDLSLPLALVTLTYLFAAVCMVVYANVYPVLHHELNLRATSAVLKKLGYQYSLTTNVYVIPGSTQAHRKTREAVSDTFKL